MLILLQRMKGKPVFLFCMMMISLLLVECKTQSKADNATTTAYMFPANTPEASKAVIIEKGDKGKVLFKMYCTECHGIFSKGKDSIPNFTKDQVGNYRSRTITFQNHPSLRKLSAEQFDAILTFLQYRKVSGHHD